MSDDEDCLGFCKPEDGGETGDEETGDEQVLENIEISISEQINLEGN